MTKRKARKINKQPCTGEAEEPLEPLRTKKEDKEQVPHGEKFRVFDIYVLPDYEKVLYSISDQNLGIYWKNDDTQLQWIFRETERTADCPLGVSCKYRRNVFFPPLSHFLLLLQTLFLIFMD